MPQCRTDRHKSSSADLIYLSMFLSVTQPDISGGRARASSCSFVASSSPRRRRHRHRRRRWPPPFPPSLSLSLLLLPARIDVRRRRRRLSSFVAGLIGLSEPTWRRRAATATAKTTHFTPSPAARGGSESSAHEVK